MMRSWLGVDGRVTCWNGALVSDLYAADFRHAKTLVSDSPRSADQRERRIGFLCAADAEAQSGALLRFGLHFAAAQ